MAGLLHAFAGVIRSQLRGRWPGLDTMTVGVAFGDWLPAAIVPALLESAVWDERQDRVRKPTRLGRGAARPAQAVPARATEECRPLDKV